MVSVVDCLFEGPQSSEARVAPSQARNAGQASAVKATPVRRTLALALNDAELGKATIPDKAWGHADVVSFPRLYWRRHPKVYI